MNMNIIPVVSMEQASKLQDGQLPSVLPVLPLRGAVLFPDTVIPIPVRREKSIQLLNEAYKSNKLVGAVTQRDPKVEDPLQADLFETGTLGRIIKIIDLPNGPVTAIIQGVRRFNIRSVDIVTPYLMAEVDYLAEDLSAIGDVDMAAIVDGIKTSAMRIIKLSGNISNEAGYAIRDIDDNAFLVNFVATTIEIEDPLDKMPLLMTASIKERATLLLKLLEKQTEILKIREDIQKKVKVEIDQQQREYYLNNQLKTIQEELGMDSANDDINQLRKQAEGKNWPDYVAETFEKEIHKLERSNPNSPDYTVIYSYLQFMVDLPWSEATEDNLDLKNAQKVLDADHYGLEKVKERIIEYLAVLKLKGDMKSPILCLYGPPGVGKTSLGKSIAKALGRKYGRISLGGLHDESEIRGHRRTYIGAMAGRIIQSIKKAGSVNPVIVLDEVDKVFNDFHGDPASALLEVLDPEQNTTFHDNYLDLDYDLSKVLFITTANNVENIHPALRDRMEMINVSGYLAEEKVSIAQKHLLPKQLKEHGLTSKDLKLSKKAIEEVINEYTRESGVRSLDKQIAKLCRITARKIAMEEELKNTLTPEDVREYLGLPTNHHDMQKGNEMPGVVTGLAWTEMGGEILFIECSVSEGKGVLSTTGNLGEVMKESATIAFQYLKANAAKIGIDPKLFYERDFHIHVPEGAIPKDGPSAGITMVTAIASAIKNQCIKRHIAMTGETTLRGRVLPVGGIKEKILAAKRAGVDTIVISEENRRNIEDIKDIYIKGLTFKYVATVDEVLNFVFA
ncbi:MAG: endopeptidase La [Bacteroidales bacterium]|nr:endopeptidase La [Candidatus Equibacterium intestinale]